MPAAWGRIANRASCPLGDAMSGWRTTLQKGWQTLAVAPGKTAGAPKVWLTAVCAIAAAAVALPAAPAQAAPLDIRLEKFYDSTAPETSRIKNDAMKSLVREVALAIGPRSLGPIASQGSLGVDAGYELGISGANGNADYWKRGVGEENVPDSLVSHGFRARKGWPQSMQVGAHVTHLANSNLYALGVEAQLSVIDGFRYIPDLGVRVSGAGVMGNSKMDLAVGAVDATLSKSFGVGGVLAIQPWLGYSFGAGYFKPNLDALFPNDQTLRPITPKFEAGWLLTQRAAVGFRVVVTRVQFGFEVLRSFTDSLNLMTGKVGVVF